MSNLNSIFNVILWLFIVSCIGQWAPLWTCAQAPCQLNEKIGKPTDCFELADAETVSENVILVTVDGLRFQELFSGAEKKLISKEVGGVRDAAKLKSQYWDEDPLNRRKKLLPFFWESLATKGQIIGDPDSNSLVKVTNKRLFSYPGYNEILCGFADPKIDSNAKKNNLNTTVLEWIHGQPKFQDRVAAFCSWDVFPFIVNEKRSKIPVNAGWEKLTIGDPESLQIANRLADRTPKYWDNVRFDTFTHMGAMECIKTKKPRLIYVSYGETDDWAHDGKYDMYLQSATQTDRMIREIWELAQSMEQYQDKTTMIITTDHGRGEGREGWKNHSPKHLGSDRIWIAAIGPSIPSLGVRKDMDARQSQIAPTVAKFLGLDFTKFDERIDQPLNFLAK